MPAAFLLAASFCRGQAMPAKAALEEPVAALEAELTPLILAGQARRDCRAADPAVQAGRPLHFEVLAEGGLDQEGAARRRKA